MARSINGCSCPDGASPTTMLTETGERDAELQRHDVGCHSRTRGAVDLPLGGVRRFISFFSAIDGARGRAMVGQRAARTGG